MKRFDSESIRQRLKNRLLADSKWSRVSDYGIVGSLLTSFSATLDELARYMEYLLIEKRWSFARNPRSIRSQLDLISAQPKRRRSASGVVIVSHTDNEGNDRLVNYGVTFNNINDRSNFDNIIKDNDPQIFSRTQTLVPWTYPENYTIPRGTRFLTNNNVQFISIQSVSSRRLKEPWDTIINDNKKYQTWLVEGGWDGIKYLRIPVVQGIPTTVELGEALGVNYETFELNVDNCEEADSEFTSSFLEIYVAPPSDPTLKERWVRVPNILLAGPYDKVYQVINGTRTDEVYFKFGDNVTGTTLPQGAIVSVNYLETLGSEGNVNISKEITKIIFPENYDMIDPRTQSISNFLSTINISGLQGGMDFESMDEIRRRAPSSYLEHHTISDQKSYIEAIRRYSPIDLLKLKVFLGSIDVLLNSVNIKSQVIQFSAITSSGEALSKEDINTIETITRSISQLSSPIDRLYYLEPIIHLIDLNVIINTRDTTITSSDIVSTVDQILRDNYSILARDFLQPFYLSQFIQITKSFPFSEFVTSIVEANAFLKFDEDSIQIIKGFLDYPDLLQIKFNFDEMYKEDLSNPGFKNYRQSFLPLLKIDIQFPGSPLKSSRLARSFILVDKRHLFIGDADSLTIEESKWLFIDNNLVPPNSSLNREWLRPDESLDTFNNRVMRIAQFPLITNVMSNSYITQIFSSNTQEIRPFEFDFVNSRNVVYNIEDLEVSERYELPGLRTALKKDNRFTDYVDISFIENFTESDSIFATGILTIPLDFFEFTNISPNDEISVVNALKSQVSITIKAHPLAENFTPSKENEIIYSDSYKIEVNQLER